MKISVVTSLCILLSTTTSSVSAWGFGSSSSSKQAEEAEVEVNSIEPTSVNSRSLKTIIHEERRFVLFNSRRLSGECLPICSEPEPTNKPTFPPVAEAQTLSPTSPERTRRPTDPPTLEPTKDPSASPTKATATPTYVFQLFFPLSFLTIHMIHFIVVFLFLAIHIVHFIVVILN